MKKVTFFLLLILVVTLLFLTISHNKYWLAHIFLKAPDPQPVPIAFATTDESDTSYNFLYPDTLQNTYLRTLRDTYSLKTLLGEDNNEQSQVLKMLDWTHRRWTHNGSNEPTKPDALTILAEAKDGKNFRCVEYATVLTDALLSLGYHARTLALKSRDAEICKTGAGHVLSEVFLTEKNKWALIDAQFNIMPVLNGVPLNAVELQKAIVEQQAFELINVNGKVAKAGKRNYTAFIAPYLYFFETAFDNRASESGPLASYENKTHLMLVPIGAKQPTVFQQRFPIDYCVYTHALAAFYRTPAVK
jgi:hypothetical protein